MAANNESIVSSTVESGSGAFNCSLLQGGTLTKIIVGGIVGTAVVVAGIITGTVIGTRAQSSPPVANPVFESTFKNMPISLNPTENDIAIEDENLVDPALISLDNVNNPVNGSVSWSSVNKTVTYFPSPGFVGSEVFAYTISNDKRSAEGSINVTVINRPPVAQNDRYENVGRNTEVTLDVLANDNDADNDTLIITEYPQETELGTISPEDGALKYSTKTGQYGNEDFMYTITDGNVTATARVYINIINNPPTARPDHYSVLMNSGPTELNVLVNDEDENGDVVSLKSVGKVDNGQFQTSNGFSSSIQSATSNNITYVPNWNSPTNDAFDYTITDGTDGENNEAFATVSIDVINVPPTAKNFSFEMSKTDSDHQVNLYELINDENPYTCLDVSVHDNRGTVVLDSQKTAQTVNYQGEEREYDDCQWILKYTPDDGKSYRETFRYVVSDGFESATGFITVRSINKDPVAQPKTVTMPHVNAPSDDPALDFQIDMKDLVSDPDGDDIEIIKINSFSMLDGTPSLDENKVATFTRKSGISGTEDARYFIKDIQEDSEYSGQASALLTVELTNEGPTCDDRVLYANKSATRQSLRLCVAGPCAVCSDPENDVLNVTGFADSTNFANPRHEGNDVVIDVPPHTSGNASVTYVVSDGSLETSASIQVIVWNQAPRAISATDSFTRNQGSTTVDLSSRISDSNQDELTITGLGKSSEDTTSQKLQFDYAEAELDGKEVKIRSTANSTSTSTTYEFYYTVSDGDPLYPGTATSSISVTIDSNSPRADDYSRKYDQGDQFKIDVKSLGLVNDADNDYISLASVSRDTKADVTPQIVGDTTISYDSRDDFCEPSSFSYTIQTVDGTASGQISLETQACECKNKLDVMFVVDKSGSVRSSWDTQLNFGEAITKAMKIGPDNAKVGIVSFSDDNSIWLNGQLSTDYSTAVGYWDNMRSIYPDGSTATGNGILGAEWQFGQRGRSGVERVYIVISDGESNEGRDPITVSTRIKGETNPKNRFVAIAVGQDGDGAAEMEDIATDNEHYFAPTSYDQLEEFTNQVINRACTEN